MSTVLATNTSANSQNGTILGGSYHITLEAVSTTLAAVTVNQQSGVNLALAFATDQYIQISKIVPVQYRPTLETHVATVTFIYGSGATYNMFISVTTDGTIKYTKPYRNEYPIGVSPNLFGNPAGSNVTCPEFTFIVGSLRV